MINHDFVDLAELAEVLRPSQHVGVGEPRREADHKDQILLNHSYVGQMFSTRKEGE